MGDNDLGGNSKIYNGLMTNKELLILMIRHADAGYDHSPFWGGDTLAAPQHD